MTDLEETLAGLDRARKVTLSGYPPDATSTWHVQSAVRIGEEGDATRVAILQRTGNPAEWMTVEMTDLAGSVTVERIEVAEGGPPPGDGSDETALALEPATLEVLEVGRAKYSDRA